MSEPLRPVADDDINGVELDELPAPEKRPCFTVLDEWSAVRGRLGKMRPGVYLCDKAPGKGDDPPILFETWICGPLHVDAQTHDEKGASFGRLLRFMPSHGPWKTWAMPQKLLAADGTTLREELLDAGLEIDPKHRGKIGEYIASRRGQRVIRCVTSTGWAAPDAFVLPDAVVGPARSTVTYQSSERLGDGHGTKGTLDGWREHVAALAPGNPLLMVAVSTAFVGPLLSPCMVEGGGVHLFGDSSTGKTSALEAARSVWGGPDFRRQWRATANGIEGVAALHNDLLLPLDEIGECDGRALGEVAYMLANGVGKSRATRSGGARPAKRWRTSVLSTGETTLAAHMLKAGSRPNAGQGVRILDLPARRTFGLFDDLRGRGSGRAFADEIKAAAGTHYGTAGRTFLERLTHDGRDLGGLLEEVKALPNFKAVDGQEARAATRFALIGFAGELATEYDITGWPEGAAIEAAAEAFHDWREHRGRGQDEPTKILEAVADFIDRHGDSRFQTGDVASSGGIRDLAGSRNGSTYSFTTSGLREALASFDFNSALAVLIERGVLPRREPGRKTAGWKKISGRSTRVYHVDAEALGAALHDR